MEVGISRMSDANCGPGSESQDSGEGGEEKGGMQWWQLSLVGWYVNTKLDRFFKVFKFIIYWTHITKCPMNSYVIKPVDIVI